MKRFYVFIVLTTTLTSGYVGATDAFLPAGTYQKSCTDCKYDASTAKLTCSCDTGKKSIDGKPIKNVTSAENCVTYKNVNGDLLCDVRLLPITQGDSTCNVFPIHIYGGGEGKPGLEDNRWSEWAAACKQECLKHGYKNRSNARVIEYPAQGLAASWGGKKNYKADCCCE